MNNEEDNRKHGTAIALIKIHMGFEVEYKKTARAHS